MHVQPDITLQLPCGYVHSMAANDELDNQDWMTLVPVDGPTCCDG